MSKYDALNKHLSQADSQIVEMKFSEIEQVINDNLPLSARKHRAWWSNNPSNSVITYAWLNAGFQTEKVDMAAQRLLFRRVKKSQQEAQKPKNLDSAIGQELGVDLSKLSTKTKSWLAEQAAQNGDLSTVILDAIERHASRMQRLAVLAKYEASAIGAGSNSLDLIKEARDER
jgi:predicted transcriptional regulator